MAKVTFVTFYNDFSIGVNILSSLLIEKGHDVSVVFFKLPRKETIDWFEEDADEFMEAVDCYGNIVGGNAEVNRWTDTETGLLIDLLKDLGTQIVCFSSRTTDNKLAADVFPKVRASVHAVTLSGGFGPSLDPGFYAELVDYVFIGEAENCIHDLISKIDSGQSIRDVNNIAFMDKGRLITNPLGSPDRLVFTRQIIPDKTFYIDQERVYAYADRAAVVKTHAYSTFFGRGCISKCSYCSVGNWRELYAREGFHVGARRNRSIGNIIDELIDIKKSGVTFIHFRDEFLTGSYENMKEFFSLYERYVGLPFWAYLVPKQMLIHPDLVEDAVNAGWVDTETGFQSGSDDINRRVFNRHISNRDTLAYAHLVAKYKVNRQYDFIIFNPAEEKKHIRETFSLLQALPKDRAYLYMPRLFYFPQTPICEALAPYRTKTIDFDYYYRLALLYLICFVVPEKTFEGVLNNDAMVLSRFRLKEFYSNYLTSHGIEFMHGTHDKPESITTHRYRRIIEKHGYDDMIVWKDENYFDSMKDICSEKNVLRYIDDTVEPDSHAFLQTVEKPVPIFICSPEKSRIKSLILSRYPDYPGNVYV